MPIERVDTKTRMSRAVIHNNTVYLCGQIPKDPTAGIAEQTRTTLENVEAALEAAQSHKTKILSATIYLKDMALFQEMNAVWDQWVPEGNSPARTCVQAHMARENVLVEITITAAR